MAAVARLSRPLWSIPEWQGIALRCRSARIGLYQLPLGFPKIRLSARLIDSFLKVGRDLHFAMLRLEDLIVEQHPSLRASIVEFVHGVHDPDERPSPLFRYFRRGESEAMNWEGWLALGIKVGSWREDVRRIGMALEGVRGGKAHAARFLKLSELKRVRRHLEAIASKQEPGRQISALAHPQRGKPMPPPPALQPIRHEPGWRPPSTTLYIDDPNGEHARVKVMAGREFMELLEAIEEGAPGHELNPLALIPHLTAGFVCRLRLLNEQPSDSDMETWTAIYSRSVTRLAEAAVEGLAGIFPDDPEGDD